MLGDSLVWSSEPTMSGDTTSSDMTSAQAACPVDASAEASAGGALLSSSRLLTSSRRLSSSHLLSSSQSSHCESSGGARVISKHRWGHGSAGGVLVDRLSVLSSVSSAVLGASAKRSLSASTKRVGVAQRRGREFERAVRSGEHGSPCGGSTPR